MDMNCSGLHRSSSQIVEERSSGSSSSLGRLGSSTRNSRNQSDQLETRFGIDGRAVATSAPSVSSNEAVAASGSSSRGHRSRQRRSGLLTETQNDNDGRNPLISELGVPIKKRRFMVRSPSPSNRSSAQEHRAQINHERTSTDIVDEKPDCSGHDFSGIEILATVACSSDVTNDIVAPAVESLPAEESAVQHQDASTLSTHVEVNASSAGTHLLNESSTERPEANMEAGDKSLAGDNSECVKDVRLHWDLNVPMDVWGEPCDEEVVAPGRDVEGEITESIAPKESEPIDEVIPSDGLASSQSPKTEAAARNGQESQSGYDSQYEDGELREPYPWEETEGDTGEIEQVDYGSEPEDVRFYSMVESNHNKMECESGDAPRMREANEGRDIEKHVVVCMNYSHLKKGSSSPSRSFVSKPFKELPPHDDIQRRRLDKYEELSTGPDKFVRRDDRSGMRMRNRSPGRGYFGGWDSKRRFSPPNYKGDSYGFRRPQSNDRSMMNGFDQSGSRPGPDGHVRRQFSDGWYRGRFRRFPDGGDSDFRYSNQYPDRMHNRMRRERGNSPVLRRLHYPQSRSRSPVSWNSRNRSPPPPGGFRGDERMMERVRLPFEKRFPADQEMGFMSPPRNRMSSPRFFEGRNNDRYRERKFRPGQRFDVGNSMRRVNPDNNNHHFRPFIRHRRFEGREDNIGGNRFEMVQQRTRRSEASEDDGDDNRNGEQYAVVANNNNNNNK